MDPNNFDKSLDSVPKLLQIKITTSFDGDYMIARIIKFLFLLPNMTVQFHFSYAYLSYNLRVSMYGIYILFLSEL